MFMNYSKTLALFICALMCAACEPSLQKAPVEPRSIAGDWVADANSISAIEQQLHAALHDASQKEMHDAIKRNSRHRGDADTGEMMENRPAQYSWEMRDQHEQHQALFDMVRPAAELKIEQRPGQLTFSAADMPQRNFESGGSSTLVTTFATLHVTAGWRGDDFFVHSKDSKADVDILERYHLRPDGTLLLSVTLSAHSMETQQFTLLYHRHRTT